MATQLWNQEIDKTVDWSGDTSTGGAAVSGKFVQKFIKDTLASKFGYLHYNEETKKYQVFADKDDFNAWNADPTSNSNLVLATFDAPAPATIKVDLLSEASSTILSTEKGQKIKFKYLIQDSSNTPQRESISVRVQVTNGGVSQTFTVNYEPDYEGYKEGTVKEINIDEYLNVGVNNITLGFTGLSSQATASTTLRISVVELSVESTWDNTVAQEYDENLAPELLFDADKGNAIRIPFKAIGQGSKYIEIYVNGQEFKQPGKGISFGDLLSGQLEYSSRLDLFLSKENGQLRDPFVEGKNTIQFLIFINQDGRKIVSNTLYYDFVIKNVNNTEDLIYILYKQTLTGVFEQGKTIEFNAQQYNSTSFEYSVYSSTGKAVGLTFDLVKRPSKDGELSKTIASLKRQINSGESQTFEYSFIDFGVIDVTITTDLTDISGNPLDTLSVIVNVAEAEEQIFVDDKDRRLELNAINRSNSEPNPATWESGTTKVTFENVYWNDSAGWDGKALVLNNGAQCSIPFNFFGTNANELNSMGTTIEITFEMINVQDEDAVMLTFEDQNNTSSIKMTASEARITDNSGSYVYTKYNADNKIKLAFVVNPYDKNNNFDSSFMDEGKPNRTGKQEYKNCIFMIVNGILDKCDAYNGSSGNLVWKNAQNPKMVIGNKDGKAGIKIYSIRTYSKALTLDEELVNFIAESDDILAMHNRNNIYEKGSGSVSLDIVKNKIPTAVIYGDISAFNALKGKKENMEFDMEFYDPTDPDRDFYARGMWFSNQGTSSLAYPIRNLRPYFSKTKDRKTKGQANYYTEVYLGEGAKGNFIHGQVQDESTLGHFYTNAKTTKNGYHRLYNDAQAQKLQDEGIQLFYKASDGSFIPCKKGVDAPEGYGPIDSDGNGGWFIQAFREVKAYGVTDDYWKFLKDLRLSGCKLYKIGKEEEVENPISGTKYIVREFKSVKGKEPLDKEKKYFLQQGAWRQYHKSGYTDRWTFKADYAESTMTQNAGTGRLWGDVMKNVRYNGKYACRTDAQTAVGNLVTADDERIDIRTSCDGKPIVAFCCPLLYNEDGSPQMEDGKRKYGTPIYIGLYNIMTDKSSTKLFGFEDIYDETGKKIYKADRTECFECLTNAAEFSQGLSIVSDKDETNTNMASRSIWGDYESRWPDVKYADNNGDEQQVAHTHNLESMWRFVNFCKPAVDYKVGSADGYTLSPYSLIPDDEYRNYWDLIPRPTVFIRTVEGGNESFTPFEATEFGQWEAVKGMLYEYKNDFDYDNVHKELSGKRIEGHIYKGKVAGFDAKHGVFLEDIQFDEERVEDETNGVSFGDKIAGSPCETDYYINVFLTQNGNRYTYTDEHGKTANYTGESIERDAYEKNAAGESYAGKTYMEYFSDKKYDFFDVPRLAAYYIYVIRFAAADQVVKNTMLTTEDGQHYYYINYDNDTILGTRNDGNLVFHWNINRDSYDYEKNSFCFAGPKSVLWNLLECDEDFMRIVQELDNAMYTSNVLSADILLDMFNNKQEGSWGERMYNVNEKYKYLSQWNGTDAKYLKFIHGSAHQFRSWFVTNRFNYYDSLWESGEYLNSAMQLRLDTMNTDEKSPMFKITAARQNKFWLSNSDGRYKSLPEWKKTLKQGESQDWIATKKIYGNSSPWTLYGCDKIGVLDFRRSTGLFDLQYISFEVDGNNWMNTKGCLMTKFLIGNSDEYRTTDMFRYTNIGEADVALTKAELSGDRSYTSSIQLPYDSETITETANEDGTFTYKAQEGKTGTLNIITVKPGEYIDLVDNISLDASMTIKKEPLAKTQCSITAIGSIGKLYSLEEIDIRNCFNKDGLLNDSIDLTGLNNLHIFRSIGSSITSFVPATGAVLNEVSLPINRVKTITLDNVTLKKAEGQEAPVFKYTPDAALTSLTLNNVTFGDEEPAFDVVEFITSWIKIHVDKVTDLKSLSLTLNGVKITATVDWLKNLKNLNLVSFTGDVYVIGSDENNKMLQSEYNDLSELYSQERPFEPTSALRFNSAPAIFWSIKGENGEELEFTKFDESTLWGGKTVNGHYSILHGNTFKFQVTRFPIPEDGKMQLYAFQWANTAGTIDNKTTWSGPFYKPDEFNSGIYRTNAAGFDMQLTPKPSGYSEFISNVGAAGVRNIDRYVVIYPVENDGKRQPITGDADSIFLKITPVVNPEKLVLRYGDTVLQAESTEDSTFGCPVYKFEMTEDMKDYSFDILYSNAENVTVQGNVPDIRIVQDGDANATEGADTPALKKDTQLIVKDAKRGIETSDTGKWGGSFTLNPIVGPSKIESKKVLITLSLQSAIAESKKAILDIKIPTIMAQTLKFGEAEDMTKVQFSQVESVSETVQDASGKIVPVIIDKITVNRALKNGEGIMFPIQSLRNEGENYKTPNVPIKSVTIENADGKIPSINFFNYPDVVVKDGITYIRILPSAGNKGTRSYDYEYEFKFTVDYGYEGRDSWKDVTEEQIEKNFRKTFNTRFDISIIYPNKFKVVHKSNPSLTINELIPTINSGDKVDSKTIDMIIVPYDNTVSDPITVNITELNVKVEAITESDSTDKEVTSLQQGILIDDFIQFSMDSVFNVTSEENKSTSFTWTGTSGQNNPTLSIILNKYKDNQNISYDYNQRYVGKITISGKYTDELGKSANIPESIIDFKAIQSIAFCSSIDKCEPQSIEINGNPVSNPWFFVDSDNQYYTISKKTVETMITDNTINKLVGIAKRINLGWDDPNKPEGTAKFSSNCEFNEGGDKPYDAFNNACLSWFNEPNISLKPEHRSTAKNIYSRALCLPLANWKLSDEQLKNYGYNESTDANLRWKKMMRISGFFVQMPAWFDSKDCYMKKIFGDKEAVYGSLTKATIEALHMYGSRSGFYNSGQILSFKRTNVKDALDPQNVYNFNDINNKLDSAALGSAIDSRGAMKAYCTGEYSDWNDEQIGFAFGGFNNVSTDDIWNRESWSGEDSQVKHSAITDIWKHFELYNPQIKNDSPEADNSNVKCYIPSPWELRHIFGAPANEGAESLSTVVNYVPKMFQEIYDIMNSQGLFEAGLLKKEDTFIGVYMDNINQAKAEYGDSTIISSMDWITSQVTGSAFNKVIGNSQAVEISLGHQNETSTVYRNTMVDSDAINVMNSIMRGQKLWLPLLLVE